MQPSGELPLAAASIQGSRGAPRRSPPQPGPQLVLSFEPARSQQPTRPRRMHRAVPEWTKPHDEGWLTGQAATATAACGLGRRWPHSDGSGVPITPPRLGVGVDGEIPGELPAPTPGNTGQHRATRGDPGRQRKNLRPGIHDQNRLGTTPDGIRRHAAGVEQLYGAHESPCRPSGTEYSQIDVESGHDGTRHATG